MKEFFIFSVLFLSSFCYAAEKEPSLAEVLEWKYGLVANTKEENGKMVITKWRGHDPQPNDSQIASDTEEYKAFLVQKENSDKAEEDAIKSKLKLSESEIQAIKRILNK